MGLAILTFALILGIVFGTYWMLLVRPEQRAQAVLRKRLGGSRSEVAGIVGNLERPEQRLSQVGALEKVLARTAGLSGPLDRLITQADVKISVGTLVMSSALLSLLTYLLVDWLTYSSL